VLILLTDLLVINALVFGVDERRQHIAGHRRIPVHHRCRLGLRRTAGGASLGKWQLHSGNQITRCGNTCRPLAVVPGPPSGVDQQILHRSRGRDPRAAGQQMESHPAQSLRLAAHRRGQDDGPGEFAQLSRCSK